MNRRYRQVRNHPLHASELLFSSVRPLRGGPASVDRSFRCRPSHAIACALALLLALLAFGAGATPVKITGVLQGGSSSGAGPNFSQSWNASSPDLGPGVGCDPVLGDCYGADLYITSSGSVGAGATADVTTAPVNFSATAPSVTITKSGSNYAVGVSSPTASFSQAAPSQFSSTLGAGLSFSNAASGQICFVECASFGGSLGSYDNSFNVLGTSTANNGTLSFFGKSVPGLNGTSVPLIIPSPGIIGATNAGSIEINAPASLSGSGSLNPNPRVEGVTSMFDSVATTVANTSVDLGKVAASFTNNKYLAPEGNYTYDGVGFSYDVASAVLNLSENLVQTTGFSSTLAYTVTFFNANGTPLSVLGGSGAAQSSLTFSMPGSTTIGALNPGESLAGDYAVITGNYQLTAAQFVDLAIDGDLNFSMLSGSIDGGPFGSAGFGPVYSDDIPFDDDANLYVGLQTFNVTESQTVYFPGTSVTVPEPPNWAFMLTGVLGIGVAEATRRRRAGRKSSRTSA